MTSFTGCWLTRRSSRASVVFAPSTESSVPRTPPRSSACEISANSARCRGVYGTVNRYDAANPRSSSEQPCPSDQGHLQPTQLLLLIALRPDLGRIRFRPIVHRSPRGANLLLRFWITAHPFRRRPVGAREAGFAPSRTGDGVSRLAATHASTSSGAIRNPPRLPGRAAASRPERIARTTGFGLIWHSSATSFGVSRGDAISAA